MFVPPRLSVHALNLEGLFEDSHDFLEAYAKGCPGLEARVQEAVAVSMIAVFRDPGERLPEALPYCFSPEYAARMAYAAIFARNYSRGARKEKLDGISRQFTRNIPENMIYPLFADTECGNLQRGDEAIEAHIYGGLCRGDIFRMLPDLRN